MDRLSLRTKHPSSPSPCVSTLLSPDNLPYIEEVKVTGMHIYNVAHAVQGGDGPGGCDASHWQDAFLHDRSHIQGLRDAVANLTH